MTKLSAELLVEEEAEESEAEVEAVESPHNLSPERVTLPRAPESSQVTLPRAPESSTKCTDIITSSGATAFRAISSHLS